MDRRSSIWRIVDGLTPAKAGETPFARRMPMGFARLTPGSTHPTSAHPPRGCAASRRRRSRPRAGRRASGTAAGAAMADAFGRAGAIMSPAASGINFKNEIEWSTRQREDQLVGSWPAAYRAVETRQPPSSAGSGISSTVTIHGPSGPMTGKFLPAVTKECCRSRTLPSTKQLPPKRVERAVDWR